MNGIKQRRYILYFDYGDDFTCIDAKTFPGAEGGGAPGASATTESSLTSP